MNSPMQQIAELRAEVADLTAKNAALQRGGGNGQVEAAALGKVIAGVVEEQLRRTERSLREDFVGKFSGILSPLLERLTDRVVTLEAMTARTEAELAKVDGRFEAHLERMAEIIGGKTKAMSAEVSRQTKAAGEEMARLYEQNRAALDVQVGAAGRAVSEASALGARMAELGKRLTAVEKKNADAAAKVEAAVVKFEAATAGELAAASEAARQKIGEGAELADKLMADARVRFRKAVLGLDAKLIEHPFALTMGKAAALIFACALFSTMATFAFFDYFSREMFSETVAVVRGQVEPAAREFSQKVQSMGYVIDYAERWEALTRGMSYEEQQRLFAVLQKQAKAQGRTIEVPKSLQR